jgi:hypothetical protein
MKVAGTETRSMVISVKPLSLTAQSTLGLSSVTTWTGRESMSGPSVIITRAFGGSLRWTARASSSTAKTDVNMLERSNETFTFRIRSSLTL